MSYPQVAEVCALVRTLLLDYRVETGEIATDDVILRYMPVAWREMWDSMIAAGMERPRTTFYYPLAAYTARFYPEQAGVLNFAEPIKVEEAAPDATQPVGEVEAHTTNEIRLEVTSHGIANNTRVFVSGLPDPAAGEWFCYAADANHIVLRGSVFYGAFANGAGHVTTLASGAAFTRIAPIQTWERRTPQTTLSQYRWIGEGLQLHGATADRLLAVEAFLSAPPFPASVGDALRVDNCDNFMGYRTAALVAASQGRDDLFRTYSALAFVDKGDGQGGFLAGLVASSSKSAQRQKPERPV